MDLPADDGLRRVLLALGVPAEAYLGHGGEAWVYALDDHRVVRVLHAGQSEVDVRRRQLLVDELRRAGPPPFELPQVLGVGEVEGRWYAVERRLAGRSLMEQLARLDGAERDRLVEAHLEAAGLLGSLHLRPRGWYGDLLGNHPVRAATWHGYLVARAAASLRRSSPAFDAVDPARLAGDLPDADRASFVHLDAFAANMMADGVRVTAVLDVGLTSVSGDARLDPLAAAVYLGARPITPVATARDVAVAASWLRAAGLAEWFEPARRWLAAFWSFAVDDVTLHGWCRSVLLDG